jgi:hypothetical protein
MNIQKSFIPLMHKNEYQFVEKYLNKDDVLFEWGSGNSTIYFSSFVKKVISIEHDIDYYKPIKTTIDVFNFQNIDLYYIPPIEIESTRVDKLKNYIEFPIKKNLKFTKVLIDGRARKHCAEILTDYIDENVIIFIHDFNYHDVEGYSDENYFSDILSNYDVLEFESSNRGIVALKKKRYFNPKIYETRNELMKSFQKNLKICEVGVFKGDFSDFIYSNLKPKELHLIDIFKGVTHSGDKDGDNITYTDLNESYNNLIEKYKNTNVYIHKGLSLKVLNTFENNYFDIIYIDGDHFYESVKNDLNISYLKIKDGGVICGHDYEIKNHKDVYVAVNEFCTQKQLKIDYITKDGCPSYGIIVKKN